MASDPPPIKISTVPSNPSAIIIAILTALASFLGGMHVAPAPTPQPVPPIIKVDPAPAPTPIPEPTPVPTIDIPIASISLSDAGGRSITSNTGNNQQVIASASKAIHGSDPKSLLWIVDPPVQQYVTPDGTTLIFTTPANFCTIRIQQIVALGSKISTQTVTFTCGSPPPTPPTPPTPPDSVPPAPPFNPVKKKVLFISVVEDPLHRTLATADLLQNFTMWSKFSESGHSWTLYSDKSTEAKGIAALSALKSNNILLPGIVIQSKPDGVVLYTGPLPNSMQQLTALVKQYAGDI
jgi:hypothetical protein